MCFLYCVNPFVRIGTSEGLIWELIVSKMKSTTIVVDFYLYNSTSVDNSNDEGKTISRNPNDMYQYCINNNYGMELIKSCEVKYFQIIENSLGSDEKILICFIGI